MHAGKAPPLPFWRFCVPKGWQSAGSSPSSKSWLPPLSGFITSGGDDQVWDDCQHTCPPTGFATPKDRISGLDGSQVVGRANCARAGLLIFYPC